MLFRVKVFPGSKKKEIIKNKKGEFVIKVKSKPERGLANQETLEMLSYYLKIPKSKIRLVKGAKSRSKIFETVEFS